MVACNGSLDRSIAVGLEPSWESNVIEDVADRECDDASECMALDSRISGAKGSAIVALIKESLVN